MIRKRTAGIVLTIAAGAAVCLAVWNTSRTPPVQVIRVGPVVQYSSGYTNGFRTDPYLWLNAHEILHFNNDYSIQYPITTYDMTTHQEQTATGLAGVLEGCAISASPDGQWVLCNTQRFNTSPPGMSAIRRSDGKIVRWPRLQTWGSAGFWMPDSRHWLCVTDVATGKTIGGRPISENRLVIYDVNHPGYKSFAIPGNTGMNNILGVTPQGKVIFDDSPPIWGSPAGQPEPPLSILEVLLDKPQPTVRTVQVQVPKTPASYAARVLLSPQGDRLLWSCYTSRPNTLASWISFWTRKFYVGGTGSQDIWTCPLNGNAPHHVGTWSGPHIGFTVAWNPDGKHASMTMNNDTDLYLISVP